MPDVLFVDVDVRHVGLVCYVIDLYEAVGIGQVSGRLVSDIALQFVQGGLKIRLERAVQVQGFVTDWVR